MQARLNRDDYLKLVMNSIRETVLGTPEFKEQLSFKKHICPGEPHFYEPLNPTSDTLLVIARAFATGHCSTELSDEDIYQIAEEALVRTIIDLKLRTEVRSFDQQLPDNSRNFELP